MPPLVRQQQMQMLLDGNFDFMVCTDVIGHGINLPLCSVVFAETEKFDGDKRRSLTVWEAAQIAGRAGRGTNPGYVAYLLPFMGMRVNATLVQHAVALSAGHAAGIVHSNFSATHTTPPSFTTNATLSQGSGWSTKRSVPIGSLVPQAKQGSGWKMQPQQVQSDLKLDYACMRPSLKDLVPLGASTPFLLPLAIQQWECSFISKNSLWMRAGNLQPMIHRIECVTTAMLGKTFRSGVGDHRPNITTLLGHTASIELVWHLANAPISRKRFTTLVHAVIQAKKIHLEVPDKKVATASELEDFISMVDDIRILQFVLDVHDPWRCQECAVPSQDILTSMCNVASQQLVSHITTPLRMICHNLTTFAALAAIKHYSAMFTMLRLWRPQATNVSFKMRCVP